MTQNEIKCDDCINNVELFDKDQRHLVTLCWNAVLDRRCSPVKEERKDISIWRDLGLIKTCGKKAGYFSKKKYITIGDQTFCADPTTMCSRLNNKPLELK